MWWTMVRTWSYQFSSSSSRVVHTITAHEHVQHTVLKLAMLLKAAGYFLSVNFIFLIVRHTKNASDHLFNSLKHEYRKKNLYTMEDLVKSLGVSDLVMVVPTVAEDFNDYDKFFKDLF